MASTFTATQIIQAPDVDTIIRTITATITSGTVTVEFEQGAGWVAAQNGQLTDSGALSFYHTVGMRARININGVASVTIDR